jgi:molybdopterin-containing oxidoreductase family iron-sulfur binding subunit
MTNTTETSNMSRQWVGYDDLAAQTATPSSSDKVEISPEVELSGVSRRTFLGVMGSSAALAGVGLSGCIRKPVTKIVPYATRPEDVVEGRPLHFATAYQEGASVLGLLVESHEGRPTKLEGNPAFPESLGATNTTAQASVLGLYDLDRSVVPRAKDGTSLAWDKALGDLDALVGTAKSKPVAFVLPAVLSPTVARMLSEARAAFPQARFFRADPLWPENAFAGAAMVGGANAHVVTRLEHAEVVASFDADVLGTDSASVRHTKAFSKRRRVTKPDDPMNRLYVVEPGFSVTGAMADHRLRAKSGDVGKLLAALARLLAESGVPMDAAVTAQLGAANVEGPAAKMLGALAKDLASKRGQAVVVVGPRQPAWVHALAFAVNQALGAQGTSDSAPQVWRVDAFLPAMEGLDALAKSASSFDTIFVLGANPAHASSGALKLKDALAAAKVVHAGLHHDETGALATLHLPVSHYLEAWGDLTSLSGASAIQQPLIEPLHYTPSLLEVVARIVRGQAVNGYDLVRETWKARADFSEKAWEKWLHDGVVAQADAAQSPSNLDWTRVGAEVATGLASKTATYEVNFVLDANILDGRHANNGWLRELPDPMTKLTWENAVLLNKKTANGLSTGDLATVTVAGTSITAPVSLMPGLADGVAIVALGHGRRGEGVGRVANQHGVDAYPIVPVGAWYAEGSVSGASGSVKLANVQPSGNSLTPRAINGFGPAASPATYSAGKGDQPFVPRLVALQGNRSDYATTPDFADKIADKTFADEKVKSWMYPERPNEKPLAGGATTDDVYLNGVHQWGMSIDLNACTGCNACMVACQAENNIPVVGKDQVANGREMHWIRLDRYFSGSEDDPQAILQPLPCQQCETAPCEAVCPVKATAHSNEGLNDMAYNRCIGTRYCSNNCPFKVRRFNWFNFNQDLHPLEQMQKNPDVTVRFRGVMEKCTYCVQRINRAKIDAKIHGDGQVKDGAIVTACQQVCPADAIVFGDLRDTESRVSKAKSEPRTYQLLRELNMRARTTYLAKLKNPNPDLV